MISSSVFVWLMLAYTMAFLITTLLYAKRVKDSKTFTSTERDYFYYGAIVALAALSGAFLSTYVYKIPLFPKVGRLHLPHL